jgi:glycosyltransferase involved in cell wall biosynthesis
MQKDIGTIAVDLTPVLPGGENGGAKIFVIELLKCLARISPTTQFVLLTEYSSHDELEILDCDNMRRMIVRNKVNIRNIHSYIKKSALIIASYLPEKLRIFAERIGYRIVGKLKRSRTSKTLLHDIGADLLFCPFTAPTYYETGIPTVCTIYDLQFKEYPEFFTSEEVRSRELSFKAACSSAAVLAAISNFSRDTAIAYGEIDPCQVRTIYLRLAQRITHGDNSNKEILEKLGICAQRYLVYPANFWKHKNHEMLLTAFGIACNHGLPKDTILACPGHPCERREWLKRATKAMNLKDRVIFPGYLKDNEMATLIENCRGMVFPSLYEGFGIPVIEAMAAGVPVACSNTTSLPEIAEDAAIFFDPCVPLQISEAIIAIVNDEVLRKKLIQHGKTRYIDFSDVTLMAKEYWELFQYAVTMKNCTNMLSGIYVDGWAGKRLSIQVEPSETMQTLEFELSAPDWLPQRTVRVEMIKNGNHKDSLLELRRGKNAKISLPLGSIGGYFEMSITPTFIPVISGHGDDNRELSVIIKRCSIKRSNGQCIDLFLGDM